MLRGGDDPAGLLLRGIDGAVVRHFLLVQQRLNGGDDLRVAAGAQNPVHLGQLLLNVPLIPLGQAAGDQDFPHQTLLFQGGGSQDIVDGLGFGRVDKAAGVDDHHVASHDVLLDGVSGFLNPVHHPLAVHLILGTAKGNESNFCHISQSSNTSSQSKDRVFNTRFTVP